MPTLTQLPKDRSDQFEWFHALAKTIEAGTLSVSAVALTREVAEFVAQHLPGYAFPLTSTDVEFIEAVRTLRENEKAWNRRLMQTLIEADDQAKAGSTQIAAESLRNFAANCPWALFAEVATNQARHFQA
jgi:hypothetical protein